MEDKVVVGFDRETMEALSRQAEAHGHGVDEEVREIVRQKVAHPQEDEDWLARARAIRAMTPPGSIKVDSTRLIRASRDFDH